MRFHCAITVSAIAALLRVLIHLPPVEPPVQTGPDKLIPARQEDQAGDSPFALIEVQNGLYRSRIPDLHQAVHSASGEEGVLFRGEGHGLYAAVVIVEGLAGIAREGGKKAHLVVV